MTFDRLPVGRDIDMCTWVDREVAEFATLGDLASRIDRSHVAVLDSAHAGVEHAINAGRLLVEAKKHFRHGEWIQWVESQTMLSPRTARAYMLLAKRVEVLPDDEKHRLAHLSTRKALTAIARHKPADEKTAEAKKSHHRSPLHKAIKALIKLSGEVSPEQAAHDLSGIERGIVENLANWLLGISRSSAR